MEFLLYLSPAGREVYNLISHKIRIVENAPICRQQDIYGWFNYQNRTLTMCTSRIKSGNTPSYYINETIFHESAHVAQNCKSFFKMNLSPLGVSSKSLTLSGRRYEDWKNSVSVSGGGYGTIEKEAYYLEDKPNKVKYYLKKFCF